MNLERKAFSIEIKSQITKKWLYWLGFKYKDIKKDIIVNRYKWSDLVKNCQRFLTKIEKLNLYLVEFNKNNAMKDKTYPFDCVASGKNCQLVIVITYNKCIFSTNNGIPKTWTRITDIFLHSQNQEQSIMVFKILLLFNCLNHFSLFEQIHRKIMKKRGWYLKKK